MNQGTTINPGGATSAAQVAAMLDSAPVNTAAAVTPEMLLMLLERRLDDTDEQIGGVIRAIEANTARSEAIQRRVEALQLLKTAMANKQGEPGEPVNLSDVTVEWNGQEMTGVELLNELGITDLSTKDGVPVDPNGLSEAERAEKEERLAEIEAQLEDVGNGYYERLLERYEGARNKRGRRRMKRRLKRAKRRLERRNPGVDIDALTSERDKLRAQLDPSGESGVYKENTELTGTALDSYIQQLQSQARRENSGNEMAMIQLRSAMSQREQSVTMVKSMMDNLTRNLNKLAQF